MKNIILEIKNSFHNGSLSDYIIGENDSTSEYLPKESYYGQLMQRAILWNGQHYGYLSQ